MRSRLALAVSFSLFVSLAAPAWAGTLQFFEDSLGSPGVTAVFAPGSGLVGDIDGRGLCRRVDEGAAADVPLGDRSLLHAS